MKTFTGILLTSCWLLMLLASGCKSDTSNCSDIPTDYVRSSPPISRNNDTPLERWMNSDVVVLAEIVSDGRKNPGKALVKKCFKGKVPGNLIEIRPWGEPLKYFLKDGDEVYLFLEQDREVFWLEGFDDVGYVVSGVVLDYFKPAVRDQRIKFYPITESARVVEQQQYELELQEFMNSEK